MELPITYTAIFGRFDVLKPPLHPGGSDWVCLADDDFSAPKPWTVTTFTSPHDSRRRSRYCKLHPHIFFPEADITIWHGGNVQLTRPIQDYVNLLGDGDVAALPHPLRTSVYAEADTCVRNGLISTSQADRQMDFYRSEGFPGTRLHAAFLLVRRNSPAMIEFNEFWWSQIQKYTVRDQLSFDYCLWKLGIEVVDIPYSRGSHNAGPYHRRTAHRRARPARSSGTPPKREKKPESKSPESKPSGVKSLRKTRRKRRRYR